MLNLYPISAASDVKAYRKIGTGKAVEAGKGAATKGEKVEFSQKSSDLNAAKNAVDALPEIRLSKVEELKRKIEQNEYPRNINVEKALEVLIANGIII